MNQQIFPETPNQRRRIIITDSQSSPQQDRLSQVQSAQKPQSDIMRFSDGSNSKTQKVMPLRKGPVPAFHPDQAIISSDFNVEMRNFQSNQIGQNQKQLQPYLRQPQPYISQPVQSVFQFNLTVKKQSVNILPTKKCSTAHAPGSSIYQSTQKQPYKRRPHSGNGGRLIYKSPEPKNTIYNQTGGFSQITSEIVSPSLIANDTTQQSHKIEKIKAARKSVSRILPIEVIIKQSKEELYEKALTAQIKVNDLYEENRKLHTRIQFMENQMGLEDSTGQVFALKRQIKDLRANQVQLEGQLDQIKYKMQTTNAMELKIENELLNSELIRLREKCCELLKNQDGVNSGNNKVDLSLELYQEKEKSQALLSQLNIAKSQIAQLTQVQQDFKAQQILNQDQVKSLKSNIQALKQENERMVSDHYDAMKLQKEKYEKEIEHLKNENDKIVKDQKDSQGNAKKFDEQLQSTQEQRDNLQKEFDMLRELQQKSSRTFKDQIKALQDNLQEEQNKNKNLSESLKKEKDKNQNLEKSLQEEQEKTQNLNLNEEKFKSLNIVIQDLEKSRYQETNLASEYEKKFKQAESRLAIVEKENEALRHEIAQPKQMLQMENRFSETFDRGSSIAIDSHQKVSQSQVGVSQSLVASQEIKRQNSEIKQVESNYEQSSDANYRRSIDSDKVKANVKELMKQQTESRENVSEDFINATPEEESTNELLTAQSAPIKDALYTVKRACQVHALKFEQIDTWLFGNNYRIEQKVSLEELSSILNQKLKLQSLQANLFSRFLVEQCNAGKTEKITSESKVLACRVVSIMMSNLNVHCNGIQHYSDTKVKKMQLIIGEHLLRHQVGAEDFDDFGQTLNQFGLGKETLDCAYIHLLKLSDSYQRVNIQVLQDFIQQCRTQAKSFSATGMSFPVQEELLEYSVSEASDRQQSAITQEVAAHGKQQPSSSSQYEQQASKKVEQQQVQSKEYEEMYSENLEDADLERMESGAVSYKKLIEVKSEKHVHFTQDENFDLTTAILNGSTQRIYQLIEKGEVTLDSVLLQICQHSQDPELLEWILNAANRTAQDEHGRQALHICSANAQMLQVLFKHEPEDPDPFDNNGWTPLMMAVRNSEPACVQMCLENSCNPFLVNADQISILEIADALPDGESKAVINYMIQQTIQEWLENLGEEGVEKTIKYFKPKDNAVKISQKNIKEEPPKKEEDDGQPQLRRLKTSEQKPLQEAIQSNDFTYFKKLIEDHYPCEDALIKVCKFGNDARFIRLLVDEFEFDINYQDSAGLSGLHHACSLGNTEFASILLDQTDIDQDLFDEQGWTPLMYAVKSEQVDTVAACLTHGCNPLLENGQQMCARRIARRLPHIEKSLAIKALVEDAIYSWVQNLEPEQILMSMKTHSSNQKSNQNIKEELPKKEEDDGQPQLRRLKTSEQKPLQEAIQSNDFTYFKKLIEDHYPCEDALIKVCKFGNDARFIRLLVDEFEFDINYQDSAGLSGLHHACSLGNTEFASILLDEAQIDQDLFDEQGWTPLMYAVKSEQVDTVAACLTHGCNPLLENGQQMCARRIAKKLPHKEKSLAIIALIEDAIYSWVQNLEPEQILMSMKAYSSNQKSKTKDQNQNTNHSSLNSSPQKSQKSFKSSNQSGGILKNQSKSAVIPYKEKLRQAIENNNVLQVKKLLLEGYPPNDAYLQICLHSNDKEMLDTILDFGVDINFQDQGGRSGLHHACYAGNINLIEILLDEEDIDVDLKDKHDETPLMLAVLQANVKAVILCLNHGCNPYFINKNGESAIDYCGFLQLDESAIQIASIVKIAMDQWDKIYKEDPELFKQISQTKVEVEEKSFKPLNIKIDVSGMIPKKGTASVIKKAKTLKEEEYLTLKDKLLCAIHDDDLETVEDIIGEDAFEIDDVLLWVCQYSNDSELMLDLVLHYKPNINAQDMSGRSALHLACIGAKHQQIELLLSQDNIEKDLHDNGGETPLMQAVKSQCRKAVLLCINGACNPFQQNYLNESVIDYTKKFIDKTKSANIEDIIKDAALEWIENFSEAEITTMIKKTNSKSPNRATPDLA